MLHMRYCCLINGVCTNSVHAWGVGFKIQAGKVRWISLTISRLAAGFSRSFAFSIRFCRIFLPTIRLHFVTVSVQLVTIAWIHSGERVQQQYEKRFEFPWCFQSVAKRKKNQCSCRVDAVRLKMLLHRLNLYARLSWGHFQLITILFSSNTHHRINERKSCYYIHWIRSIPLALFSSLFHSTDKNSHLIRNCSFDLNVFFKKNWQLRRFGI